MREKISRGNSAAALTLLFLLTCAAIQADAHNVILLPSKMNAAVGETVEVAASISEPLGVPDMPFIANEKIDYVYGPLKLSAFEGDRVTDLDFGYFNLRSGARKGFTYEEAEAAFLEAKKSSPDKPSYDVMTKILDSNVASYKIASGGTVTFAGSSSYGTDTVVKCLMKAFVNLTNDGESTKARAAHFGFDGIELCPVDDLAAAKPNGKTRVEALLNGKPQSGVVVYIGCKDMEESKRISPIIEYSGKADPIMDAGVTDVNGIVELTLPGIPDGAEELKDVYIFTDGHLTVEKVRYRSTVNFTLKK
jgi:uncharacterized GH25 family protein